MQPFVLENLAGSLRWTAVGSKNMLLAIAAVLWIVVKVWAAIAL